MRSTALHFVTSAFLEDAVSALWSAVKDVWDHVSTLRLHALLNLVEVLPTSWSKIWAVAAFMVITEEDLLAVNLMLVFAPFFDRTLVINTISLAMLQIIGASSSWESWTSLSGAFGGWMRDCRLVKYLTGHFLVTPMAFQHVPQFANLSILLS